MLADKPELNPPLLAPWERREGGRRPATWGSGEGAKWQAFYALTPGPSPSGRGEPAQAVALGLSQQFIKVQKPPK